jgi:hypothetical protein
MGDFNFQVGGTQWFDTRGSMATAEAISGTLEVMKDFTNRRVNASAWYSRLYGNIANVGPFGITFSILDTSSSHSNNNNLRMNVLASCAQTIQSRVASRVHPRSWWLPKGAVDYKTARTAKKLNTFCDGLAVDQEFQKIGQQCMLDAIIWGTGVAHVFFDPQTKRIKVERVLESCIVVDEQESLFGRPMQLHYIQPLDRGTIASLYPEKKADILRQDLVSADGHPSSRSTVSELVAVRESWRLACGKTPGRHTISVGSPAVVLFDEEYPFDFFPFGFLRYTDPQLGFFGHGLAEALEPLQSQLNYVLCQIQSAQRVAGTFKLAIEEGSSIITDAMDGTLGPIIPFRNTPPAWLVPPSVPPELYQDRDRLIGMIHEEAGVSQLTTGGHGELGPEASGLAIRTTLEIQQDRFARLSEIYSAFHVSLAKISIKLIQHAVEEKEIPNYEVKVIGSKRGQIIDWNSLKYNEDMFHLQAWPVSSLPIEPQGRLAQLQEYVQGGYFSQRVAKKLMDLPDIEAVLNSEQADELWIETVLDGVIDDGIYQPVSTEDNLPLFIELVSDEIQRAKTFKLDETRIDMLRTARDEAIRLGTPPPMPQVPQNQGQPLGVPGAPPVAALLPTAPQGQPQLQ